MPERIKEAVDGSLRPQHRTTHRDERGETAPTVCTVLWWKIRVSNM